MEGELQTNQHAKGDAMLRFGIVTANDRLPVALNPETLQNHAAIAEYVRESRAQGRHDRGKYATRSC